MKKYESGDYYETPFGPGGIVISDTLCDDYEFAKYRVIQFLPESYGVEHRAIYRVTEGPEYYIGWCNDLPFSTDLLQPNFSSILSIALIREITSKSAPSYPQRNIDWLMYCLTEASEKELEEHFNQVFA